jgi:hypothetical protein
MILDKRESAEKLRAVGLSLPRSIQLQLTDWCVIKMTPVHWGIEFRFRLVFIGRTDVVSSFDIVERREIEHPFDAANLDLVKDHARQATVCAIQRVFADAAVAAVDSMLDAMAAGSTGR